MKTIHWLLLIFILYIIMYFSHALILQKTVYGDGIFYFSWVRSVVVDGDINFSNEYDSYGVSAPVSAKGVLGNKHPIGAPLFWLPWYAQARTILGDSGYELSYQLIIGFISVLAALSGLILLYRLLAQSFTRTTSLISVISIALATNLLFYGAVDPVNSHSISFFAATVFLSFLFSKNVSPFLTGCALGLCALVRPQDIVLGLLVMPVYLKFSFARPGLAKLKTVVALLLGSILMFSPQFLAWYLLYGTPWTNPYLSGGESFIWWSPHFFDVLLSPTSGLFLWTPMTFLAVVGFIFWKHTQRVWSLAVFALEVAIVGSWSIWWQGASYSGRMLVSTLPILAFGLAGLYTRLATLGLRATQVFLAIIGPLAIINMLLIMRFLLQT